MDILVSSAFGFTDSLCFPLKGHEVMDGIDSIPSTLTDGEKTEI